MTECRECEGTGTVYESSRFVGPDEDPDVSAATCEKCHGIGLVCEICGAGELRYLGVESREPHGETFYDEGTKCLKCGAVQMQALEPVRAQLSADMMAALMRSVMIAKGLEKPAAVRLGMALAVPATHKEVA